MPSIYCSLIFLFLTNFFIEPTTCNLPTYLQNLELDDITSLWDKFPSIINQIKQAVNRFRCPKGWRRLGGSCYYLSNITSTPSEANQTCNQLHSNHSNLMQIRNTVELFYAAHVLTKNNLSALMIDIDPNLFKGKSITEILMDDQGRWQRMKDKFRELRVKYYQLKEKVIDELHAAGLRISRRSKKIKQSAKKHKEKLIPDHIDPDVYDDYDYYGEHNRTNYIFSNDTTEVDEYEYENIDSEEEKDEFERMDDIRGICDQIDWNVLNNNVTTYMLTTFLIGDKIVCSLSNVEPDIEYEHVCEYVLDFCFANIICGKHGRCVNTLSGFKCSCTFLYGGILCERISKQGKQIIIGIILVVVLYGLSIKPIRWTLRKCIEMSRDLCKYYLKKRKQNKKREIKEDKEKLVSRKKREELYEEASQQRQLVMNQRRPTIAEEIMNFIREMYQCITLPRNNDPIKNPNKRDLVRLFWVGGLSIFFLTLLLSITTIVHFTSFKYGVVNETKFESLINDTIQLVMKCGSIASYRKGNLAFFPIALALILIFSWSIKRERKCLGWCDSRPGLIAPIEPFRTANRFTTATVFGILAFEVLKIFEELVFNTGDPLNRGVLIELLERIALVLLIGLRYYPVLASLQLRNIPTRFFVCLYILGDMIYTIIREGSCMGFLPLSRYYSALEEAKLRMELGTWFIIYGLVKNTPHFILLSYISAELCVRFGYDSIYVPCKKKQSIWSAPVAQPDESAFAKYYVTKLFRRNVRFYQRTYAADVNIDELDDFEYEAELQKKANQSRVKTFFDWIYHWDDDFRFTTMATCTYTVAMIFLYYLACTLVFLYISRTTGHISVVRYYIETTFNIEFKGFFSLRSIIITSAFLAVTIFASQLFIGMQNYKKHKLQLFKGIYEDVPSAANFKPNTIASKSVHYSGFLVGYMAWGFIICFHLIFFTLSAIRVISLQIRYFELVLAIIVPVVLVYLLKMLSTSSVGTFFFIPDDASEKLNLSNRKFYAIFIYFNFFADCFLGIASCIIRLIKATFLNIVYMARLDCSFLGRPLEKFDLGFAAYVSYLHMEVTHTNPVMLAFCYSLYEDAVARRRKRNYDDECCIAPGELDDEESVIDQKSKAIESASSKASTHSANGSASKKPKAIESTSSKASTRSANESVSKKTKIHPRETVAPIAKKGKSIDTDDEEGLSIQETKPKRRSQSPSITSDKGNQKSKQKKPSIDNDLEEEHKKDHDDGSLPPIDSTIARLIPEEQPRLPPQSPPKIPIRQDLPSEENEDDNEDDDGGVKPPTISTVSKIIPQQQPRLLPTQGTSPPRVPQRKDSVGDKDDDEDDDGGINPKRIAKQKQETEKKKPKKEATKKKKQVSDDDDDDIDDDGGIKPPSISTASKIIPQQPPRLLPTQRPSAPIVPQQGPTSRPSAPTPPQLLPTQRPSAPIVPQQGPTPRPFVPTAPQQPPSLIPMQRPSAPIGSQPVARPALIQRSVPPPVPQRQDIAADDDEDDGGINPKKIAKQKQELEKKKKQKEELKKKKQLDDDDDFDDGGIDPKIIGKQRQELEKKKKKEKSKAPLIFDDEDDDGGISKEKRMAAEKKKQELEAKKKKKEQTKAKVKQDEEDDDGVPKQSEPIKKKQPDKKVPKAEILKEEDEDDDGGRIVKSYDTVKKIMPSKQPVLDHQTKKKSPSPEAADDGSMLTSRPLEEPLLKSYDTVGKIVPKVSTDYRKTKEESHYDIIPTDEERAARAAQAIYSPPSYDKATNQNDLFPLRTISYREAQGSTTPLIQQRPTGPSSLRSHSKSNEDSSHYSEITNDTVSSGVINHSYSHTGSLQSASNHSIKQLNKEVPHQTLKEEQQTEESTIETEEESEEEEEDEEEEELEEQEEDEEEEEVEDEEEEEEEKKPSKEKFSKQKQKPLSSRSTAFATISHLVNPEGARKIDADLKRKQARFRWFLAYTLLNNYHLFDLRKQVQSRLARLRIERSNLIDEQQAAAAAAAASQQAVVSADISAAPALKQRKLKITPPTPEIPVSPPPRPAVTPRLLSVPVPVIDNYPQSPAERYVAIRSCMLYDAAQQSDTSRSAFASQVPSTVSQQGRTQLKAGISPKSLGFEPLPTIAVQPPSDSTTTSRGKRPPYQRQETERSTPLIINPTDGTPIFQAISESTHSTADYPLANGSSIANSSTLRTQMSHAQHMQAWRQQQLKRIQKKRPHCYHYGAPLQRPLEEKVATAAILTPQIISTDNNLQKIRSSSPFRYPHQTKTINEKQTKSTSSSSNTDKHKQDKSIEKKSLRATVKRKDSQNSFSNVTEV